MSLFSWIFDRKKLFIGLDTFSPRPVFGDLELSYSEIVKHPILAKIFSMQCDLFSLGKFHVKDSDGNIIEDDYFLDLIKRPNPFEDETEFLWVYMCNLMLGDAYIYTNSKVLDEYNFVNLSILDRDRIEIPEEVSRKSKELIKKRTDADFFDKATIKYYNEDFSGFDMIRISDILHISDFHVNDHTKLKGSSRIEAIRKFIANSEESLNADNINIRYSGKFLVSGKNDIENVTSLPLSSAEKNDIESKVNDRNPVRAIKSPIDINRYVSDLDKLKLSEKYKDYLQFAANTLNIPRDVIEAYTSSTYENQEQARAAHVVYTLQPKGDMLAKGLTNLFNYNEVGKTIELSWDHLPFMDIFKDNEMERKRKTIETMEKMMSVGFSIEEINKFLGTSFEKNESQG